MKPDAKPKFCRAQTAPYAFHDAIEKDLTSLQQLGIIESVKYSDWAAPIVSVPTIAFTLKYNSKEAYTSIFNLHWPGKVIQFKIDNTAAVQVAL